MSENNFQEWCKVIKDIPMRKRDPMWDQAIKYLVSECAMEPTIYDTLTQGQIQGMILEAGPQLNIWGLFQDIGAWVEHQCTHTEYAMRFSSGAELWLAYLMATRYALEWNGEEWVGVR
jgi:hypothetical protein